MKRINIFVLLCILILTLTSGAWASVAVATYNGTAYDTLQEAVTAATGADSAVIKMTGDTEEVVEIPEDTTITLNLNGKKISYKTTVIGNSGTLTIIDRKGGGSIESTNNIGICAQSNSITNLGSLTNSDYNNFTVTAQESTVAALATTVNAIVNIYGGTYVAADNAVLATNGSARDDETADDANTFNIYGGTFKGEIETEGYIACGIYAPNYDIWNLYGGTFTITGGAGIVVRAGQVNIPQTSTVMFTTTANDSEGWVGDKQTALKSAAIVFDKDAQYPGLSYGDCLITIEGGYFDVDESAGTIQIIADTYEYEDEIVVAGGTFVNDDVDDYLPAGYVVVEDTYYTVYRDTAILELPTASAIIEGQSLDKSVISGGTVQAVTSLSSTTSVDVEGTWTWITPSLMPKVSDDNKTKYGIIFTPDDDEGNAKIISAEITLRVNPASGDTTGYVKSASVSGDTLVYEVEGTVSLTTLLSNPNINLSTIKKLPINSKISSITNSDLLRLNLDTLDLTSASGLSSGSTLNLSGVTIGTVTMSGNTNVGTLTLSSASKVSHINAGGAPLTTVTLAGNTTIETVNLSDTGVGTLDASGCTNLKTLNTSLCSNLETLNVSGCSSLETLNSQGAELTSVNLEDCDSLTTLDVSNNALLFLDISELVSLTTGSWSGQENYKSFKSYKPSDNQINLASFILAYVSSATSADIAARITSVKEFDSSDKEVQQAEYDSSTGIATFGTTPTGYLVYYVNVDDVTASDSEANLAANETSMDVTLYNNEASASSSETSVLGPSNAGCNSLGIRSVLLFLTMFIFACAKTKRL